MFPRQLLFDLANAVMDSNGFFFQYRHLMAQPEYQVVWGTSYTKELVRLDKGLPGVVDSIDTRAFVTKDEVPFDRLRDVTYGQIVYNYREGK